MRIHNTTIPNLIIRSTDIQDNKFKPKGLWYGIETKYLNWCKLNAPNWIKPFNYSLTLDFKQILSITSENGILEFNDEYSNKENSYCPTINWKKVSEEYSGIEITTSLTAMKFYRGITWYCGWDVSSGCIWDKRAILKYKKVRGVNGKTNSNV